MCLAITRLNKELQSYQTQTNKNVQLYLKDKDNAFQWQAKIKGPPDTPYEEGEFLINIKVPNDYPVSAPECKFMTKIFHPNIEFNTGAICFELLKDKWSPQWTLESVCMAILNLLSNPNADSPLNCDCGNLIRHHDFIGYNSLAKMYTIEYATSFKPPQKKKKST